MHFAGEGGGVKSYRCFLQRRVNLSNTLSHDSQLHLSAESQISSRDSHDSHLHLGGLSRIMHRVKFCLCILQGSVRYFYVSTDLKIKYINLHEFFGIRMVNNKYVFNYY
jgi:hypothetical protein